MKKILMMLMCISLLSGCRTDNDPVVDDKTNNNNTNDVADNNNDTADNTNDWYNRFEKELKGKNVTYSNRNNLDATMIGGAEGYRYTTENGNIDVYRFEDTNKLDQIAKDKKITIDNKEYNVEVRDKMVIVTDNLADDIRDIFRGMK